MSDPIYLDHAATTPVHPEVYAAMQAYLSDRFGNPSSMHRWGREARAALDEARERVAACLGARGDEVMFTSGGTEGDNTAVVGTWRAVRAVDATRTAIVCGPAEHKAVLEAVHEAAREGATERHFALHATGEVDLPAAAALIGRDTAVVSLMWINNEVGTVQPMAQVTELAKAAGAVMHTDAVQSFGKVAVDVREVPVDLLTISGHKLGAPKGIGALYVRRGTPYSPLLVGGSQERGRRPGTENVAAAVALAVACERAVAHREAEWKRLEALRDALEAAIHARVPDAIVHGIGGARAPHITNVSAPGCTTEGLLMSLDLAGIAASGGSACQSGSVNPSHVLAAMGVSADVAGSAVRMSFGVLNGPDDVTRIADAYAEAVARSRQFSALLA
jgi:cysteine desulfurase